MAKHSERLRIWAQAFISRSKAAHQIAWLKLTEGERLTLEAVVRTRGQLSTFADEVLADNGGE